MQGAGQAQAKPSCPRLLSHEQEMGWRRERACMRRSTTAASETVRAKTEMQSSARHARTTPVVDTRPTVGFMPTQPQKCAGTRPGPNTQASHCSAMAVQSCSYLCSSLSPHDAPDIGCCTAWQAARICKELGSNRRAENCGGVGEGDEGKFMHEYCPRSWERVSCMEAVLGTRGEG